MPQSGATVPRERASGEGSAYQDFALGFESWEDEFGTSHGGVPGRRTVTITGHGVEGWQTRNGTTPTSAQRLTRLKRHEREGFRPDRVAMWAVLLGIVLLLVAVTSSHAAVLAVHHALH
jgi:hypothetical protein